MGVGKYLDSVEIDNSQVVPSPYSVELDDSEIVQSLEPNWSDNFEVELSLDTHDSGSSEMVSFPEGTQSMLLPRARQSNSNLG